jgi:hypothetical protein
LRRWEILPWLNSCSQRAVYQGGWGGCFLIEFNEPRGLVRAFADIMWSNGVNLRATGESLPSYGKEEEI